jgi:hypothetical protein
MPGIDVPLSPIVSPITHLLHKQLFGGFVGPLAGLGLAVHAGYFWLTSDLAPSLRKAAAALELSILQENLFFLDHFIETSRVDLNLALVEGRVLTLTKKLSKDERRPGKNRIIQV